MITESDNVDSVNTTYYLSMESAMLFDKYGILITVFSYKVNGVNRFRAYFKSLRDGYIFNPIKVTRDDINKTSKGEYIGHFDYYAEAMKWIVDEAKKYIQNI